jgi:hypothetical protein
MPTCNVHVLCNKTFLQSLSAATIQQDSKFPGQCKCLILLKKYLFLTYRTETRVPTLRIAEMASDATIFSPIRACPSSTTNHQSSAPILTCKLDDSTKKITFRSKWNHLLHNQNFSNLKRYTAGRSVRCKEINSCD